MHARFQVEVDGQPREAKLEFGGDRDVRPLTRRRFQSEPGASESIPDALEYARLTPGPTDDWPGAAFESKARSATGCCCPDAPGGFVAAHSTNR